MEGKTLKLYEIIIKPLSGFGTPLKGDTLFGHICWQAADYPGLLNGGLDRWIACYGEKPFTIFSSAWPKLCENGTWFYAVKRPDVPLNRLFHEPTTDRKTFMKQRKTNAGRKWLLIPENLRISLQAANYRTDKDLVAMAFDEMTPETKQALRGRGKGNFYMEYVQPHNTINRLTMTTGDSPFAPFSTSAFSYYPETKLGVFVLIEEEATDIDQVYAALERIGKFGFGRDASAGMGRFTLGGYNLKEASAEPSDNGCYALAPVIPEAGIYRHTYFAPFTRFGRHGDVFATSAHPFKNPVIMADEGAVFIPIHKEALNKPFMGKPARNVSKIIPQAVVQGYAPCLPFQMEMEP